jgi:hypothetical protein
MVGDQSCEPERRSRAGLNWKTFCCRPVTADLRPSIIAITQARKIGLGILAIVLPGGVLYVWTILDTWRKLPEAYAGWDVGTMLVCLTQRNENRWPKSWDELTAR